ncbi:hypothetical protein [Dactylosporangium sp. CA-233914]|uniref:hypothetical protein n=1 Tax=Dactylosporangium sp. CA-233914 TaxID=3239934 RepID=UPI003D8F7A16
MSMTVAARPQGRRRGTAAALHWLSDVLVVVGPDDDGAIADAVSLLPPEPGMVTVVAELRGPGDWDVLREVLPIAVPPGSAARLCVSGVASPTGSGRAPVAALAEALQADVLAPAGRLLLVPGGAMFAVGGWRRYDGQGLIARAGRRAPTPAWEAVVDDVADRTGPGLVAIPIPAGVWIYRADPRSSPPRLDELPYSVPMDPSRPLAVLGRPGTPVPDPAEVERLVAALPPSTVIAPYGSGVVICAQLVARLVHRWRVSVEVATGLPTLDAAGRPVCTFVDPDGVHAWQPLHARLRAGVSGQWQPVGPVDCLADLPAWAGGYRIAERWLVEPVQSGLWVRPPRAGPRAAEVRDLPWDPAGMVIHVGLPGTTPDDDVLPLLQALLARLPRDTARRTEVRPAGRTEVSGAEVRPGRHADVNGSDRAEVRPGRHADVNGSDRAEVRRARHADGAAPGPRAHREVPVDLTPDRIGPPGWWRPDPRLFTVVIDATRPDGTARTDAGELGETLAGVTGWGGRPILLVADGPVSPDVQDLLADQTQTPVVANDGSGWCGMLPRRVRTVAAPQIRFAGRFPFAADDLAELMRKPGRPLAVLGNPDGDGPLDLADGDGRAPRGGGPVAGAATAVVIVDAGPGSRHPFRIRGRPVDAWRLAVEIARQRPAWTHRDRVVRLIVDRIDRPALQLLANYLGSPVEVRADRLAEPPSDVDGPGWRRVRPRRPDDPTSI